MEKEKPTHFDMGPFLVALKRFISVDAAARSHLRTSLNNMSFQVRNIFVDDHGEQSFKRCLDVSEIA